MAKKATRGWTAGVHDGSGSHSPLERQDRVITGDDRPGFVIRPVPKMRHDSADGVVTRPKRHDSQGWYPNEDVRQVES